MNGKRITRLIALALLICALALALTGCEAANDAIRAPSAAQGEADSVITSLIALLGNRKASVQIVALLTLLSLAPSILIMFTCFTRVIIVLSFTKNAIGMQQMPPSQVLVGLALFLTFFIMTPVAKEIQVQAYEPYIEGAIEADEAAERAIVPIKNFMLRQTFNEDLSVFLEMAPEKAEYENVQDIPLTVVTPAFITSELKRGFMMGFFIYIPFIVIDFIVASTLLSMGMMMLPPTVISLPFKVLLFVVVDGWSLTIQTLVTSFG